MAASLCEYSSSEMIKVLEDYGLNEEMLVTISVKRLNKILKETGIDTKTRKRIKAHKRTLKNRGYANLSRTRQDNVLNMMMDENEVYMKGLEEKKTTLISIKEENMRLQQLLLQYGCSKDQVSELMEGEGGIPIFDASSVVIGVVKLVTE